MPEMVFVILFMLPSANWRQHK